MKIPSIHITPPEWLAKVAAESRGEFKTVEERMALAISLSRLNIKHKTGGPFGAAIFNMDTSKLVAPGVNLVVESRSSIAHAEVIAITLSQQILNNFDLSESGGGRYELVTSTEPCAMCFGAIPWSGIISLVCGASGKEAEAIGFDEGPKGTDWVGELTRRKIEVRRGVMAREATEVLNEYKRGGGAIYNGKRG